MDQLMLDARAVSDQHPESWAAEVEAVFEQQGLSVTHQGRTLDDPAEIKAELQRLAFAFEADRLPLLIRLGVTE